MHWICYHHLWVQCFYNVHHSRQPHMPHTLFQHHPIPAVTSPDTTRSSPYLGRPIWEPEVPDHQECLVTLNNCSFTKSCQITAFTGVIWQLFVNGQLLEVVVMASSMKMTHGNHGLFLTMTAVISLQAISWSLTLHVATAICWLYPTLNKSYLV